MRGDLTTRKIRTASGATAVQVVRYEGKRRIVVKHIGSAHDEDAVAILVSEAESYAEAHRVQPSLLTASDNPSRLVDLSKLRLIGVTNT